VIFIFRVCFITLSLALSFAIILPLLQRVGSSSSRPQQHSYHERRAEVTTESSHFSHIFLKVGRKPAFSLKMGDEIDMNHQEEWINRIGFLP